jgi:hypothetical protein
MTPAAFRKLALSLPNVVEQAHMGHPDFRVDGKIFATLDYPRPGWAAVGLAPFDQDHFVRTHPRAFVPVKGKWGEQGATNIVLRSATPSAVAAAVRAAYDIRLARSSKRRTASRAAPR